MNIQYTPLLEKTRSCKSKTIIHAGGARSSKSWSVAQFLVEKLVTQMGVQIGITRKTFPALRMTALKLVVQLLKEYGIYDLGSHNKTFNTFAYRNKDWPKGIESCIQFFGMDEPEKLKCFHPDTEILTDTGWVNIKEVNVGDLVASLDPSSGTMSYQPASKVFAYNYTGEMYTPASATEVGSSHINFCVTPNHKMLTDSGFAEVKDLPKQTPIPVSATYDDGVKPKYFQLGKGLSYSGREPRRIGREKIGRKTRVFPIVTWLKFLGWYLSEGSSSGGNILISQTKEDGREQFKKDTKCFPYKIWERPDSFGVFGGLLERELKSYGLNSHDKRIPHYVFSLHPSLLIYLFRSLMAGDGTRTSENRFVYGTSSSQLADDVSHLAVLLGYSTTKYFAKGSDSWQIFITKRQTSELYDTKKLDYTGKVYCLETNPHHTVLQRFHGKTCWIGQSTEFHYIWVEEANEFTYEDYTTLKLRLSGATEARNQILLTLNPIDEGNWIPKRLVSEDDVELIHSNYKDNPFLDRDYVQMLESLVKVDENAYRVYTLGLWGRLEDLIYKNWDEADEVPEGGVWAYGLDFGYVHPSALIKVTLAEGEIYLEEKIYETGITVKDIIERLSHMDKGDIYADASAKQSIAEINGAGHRCYEAIKDVKHSIDLCKRQVFHVLKNSPHLPQELRGYHWKRDKNGELEDKPVKYKDDACDAFRYGVYGLVTRYGFATAEPNSEGPRQRTYA